MPKRLIYLSGFGILGIAIVVGLWSVFPNKGRRTEILFLRFYSLFTTYIQILATICFASYFFKVRNYLLPLLIFALCQIIGLSLCLSGKNANPLQLVTILAVCYSYIFFLSTLATLLRRRYSTQTTFLFLFSLIAICSLTPLYSEIALSLPLAAREIFSSICLYLNPFIVIAACNNYDILRDSLLYSVSHFGTTAGPFTYPNPWYVIIVTCFLSSSFLTYQYISNKTSINKASSNE